MPRRSGPWAGYTDATAQVAWKFPLTMMEPPRLEHRNSDALNPQACYSPHRAPCRRLTRFSRIALLRRAIGERCTRLSKNFTGTFTVYRR